MNKMQKTVIKKLKRNSNETDQKLRRDDALED
jgi:hypothetical protein